MEMSAQLQHHQPEPLQAILQDVAGSSHHETTGGKNWEASPRWDEFQRKIEQQNFVPDTPDWYIEKLQESQRLAELGEAQVSFAEAAQALIECYEEILGGRSLELDEYTKPFFRQVSMWIARDPRGDFDPQKGIAVFGSVGTGKTAAMRAIRAVLGRMRSKRGFRIHTCREDVYGAVLANPQNLQDFFDWNRCFDDLGDEPTTLQSFGNRTELLADILSSRFTRWEASGSPLTFITSNLSEEAINERYGERAFDRLRTMCNFWILDGSSRR